MRLREKFKSLRENGYYTSYNGRLIGEGGKPIVVKNSMDDDCHVWDYGTWTGLVPVAESK